MLKKKKKWEIHEQETANSLGGKLVPCSGRLPHQKGDVSVKGSKLSFLVECKATDKDGYRISKKLWNKIELEAVRAGKIPILSIKICGKSYIVCEQELFSDLTKGMENDNKQNSEEN